MDITKINVMAEFSKLSIAEITPPDTCCQEIRPQEVEQEGWTDLSEHQEFDKGELDKVVAELNKSLANHDTKLQFAVHEVTKQIMVRVVDANTGEVVREVPPKKILDMVAMTWKENGLLVDKRA